MPTEQCCCYRGLLDSSLALVLLIALALGAVAIALLITPATIWRNWTISRQKKRIDELEKKLEDACDRFVSLENPVGTETGTAGD